MDQGDKMKVGDLVKHWRCSHGIGIVIEKYLWEGGGSITISREANHKVVWPDGEWGWYTTCRLQKVSK